MEREILGFGVLFESFNRFVFRVYFWVFYFGRIVNFRKLVWVGFFYFCIIKNRNWFVG